MLTVAGGQGVSPTGRETNSEHSSGHSDPWTTGDVSQAHEDNNNAPPETRCCELCGATTTPMWRRGPSGKGTVCNACGVRWASRRRAPRKHADDSHSSHAHEHVALEPGSAGIALEQYYCKYCGVTWPLNYFKNRQQFGAHCSNCSRKRKSRAPPPIDLEPISTSSPRESHHAPSSPTGPLLPHLNLRAAALSHHGHTHLPSTSSNAYPAPRKMPRADLHLMGATPSQYAGNAAQLSLINTNRYDTDDFVDELSPPHKRAKLLSTPGSTSQVPGSHHHNMSTNMSVESGDETYNYESDSETALSPYGPSATSLHRLLGAVENVLTEEREMATTLAQLEAMRTMIDSVEETRKRTLGKLEAALMHQLNTIQSLASLECIEATITEKQRADEEAAKQQAGTNATDVAPSEQSTNSQQISTDISQQQVPSTAAESETKMQVDSAAPAVSSAITSPTNTNNIVASPVNATSPIGATTPISTNPTSPTNAAVVAPTLFQNKEVTKGTPATTTMHIIEKEAPRVAESQAQIESAEAHVEDIMGPMREPHHSVIAPTLTMPLQLLSQLPPDLETAAMDLSSVFANATLLQLGSQADVEAFKQFFVQSLAQSKVRINQEVALLFETLGALKTRQTQLGQNTFIDQLQLRNLSTDLHELKQRVVHASRAVQNAFVQLVTQFTEQIETAKRIYQESAGNNVKLLDEIIRTQLTPQLTSQVDLLKRQLLAHVNCVRANLAYLDTLVLNTE